MTIPQTRRLQEAAAQTGASLEVVQTLAGDGSERRFYRLLGSPTVVLLLHPGVPLDGVNENDSYYYIGTHLRRRGVAVPDIYHYCREEGWLLLEDVGDISLHVAMSKPVPTNVVRYWYRQALQLLVQLQLDGRQGFDPAWCFDTPVVDRAFLMERECRYFLQAFIHSYAGLPVPWEELAGDFDALLGRALPAPTVYLLHRDFQSRNLFLKDGRLRLIDFQGARLGPLGYDVAALLIDPYVNLAPEMQQELWSYYVELLKERLPAEVSAFQEHYPYLALCRNLQILGAYGFLSVVKKKDFFRRYIPAALTGLERRLRERSGEFPELERVTQKVKSLILARQS